MAKSVLHKAESRGKADHGWLKSFHTFSFANYYDPGRMHFGVLRVLNDDTVAGGKGFDTHRHDNMEIISIPLEGDLEHKDSMGTVAVIRKGDVQVMSAGTGIAHSEYNRNPDKQVKFLQIWVMPDKKNVKPRYGQVTLKAEANLNKLQQVLSPDETDEGVWIHQQAWFYLGRFTAETSLEYKVKRKDNGIYIFVLAGNVTVNNQPLSIRDGFGIWETEVISITASKDAEILVMDVPMN